MRKKIYKILFIVLLSVSINCIRDKNPIHPDFKYFQPEELDQLDLEKVIGFWTPDSLIIKSESNNSTFIYHKDLIKCIRYKYNNKHIGVSVFPSQISAIKAMEFTINDVACIIKKDTTSTLSGLYWYSDCIPNMVFVNKWNTIIEVGYYHQNYNEIKETLYATAFEIAKRVDNLSE